MAYIERMINFKLPPGQSAFFWGPRKTGKSTLLTEAFPVTKYQGGTGSSGVSLPTPREPIYRKKPPPLGQTILPATADFG